MKFFPTAEGYFNYETGKYVYNYTDHLGNTRLSYAKNGAGTEIIEENNYYPFGLKHEGYNVLTGNPAYKYKYNGKELQETGMYDYGARMYMPDLGRWGVVDPLAEKYRRHSPYNYVVNNPLRFIDPDGMQVWPPEGGNDGQTWSDSDGDFVNRNGTWYKDNGSLVGLWAGDDWRYDSVGGTTPTSGYDGKTILSSSNYDYTYDLMPGKQADDENYWKNGSSGNFLTRLVETTARDASAKENITTTIEAVLIAAPTSRAARRSTMREEGIPTSQQPVSQSKNASGREYTYEVPRRNTTVKSGSKTEKKSVQEQTMDRSHPGQSHWEAGSVKTDREGNVRMNNYGRPKLQNDKSKVNN